MDNNPSNSKLRFFTYLGGLDNTLTTGGVREMNSNSFGMSYLHVTPKYTN